MKTTDADRVLLAKMASDPPGTVRSVDEKFAFEHAWDDAYGSSTNDSRR